MRCLDVEMELQAYVDGELSPERAVVLEQHLTACDACRAKVARLRAVVVALKTWPLVAEPARLTARVMAQVRLRPALPRFRLGWSDFVISLGGAGLAFAAMLVWRHLAPTSLAYLPHYTQIVLQLEILRLEALLQIQRLVETGAIAWGLVGVMLTTALALAVWYLAVGEEAILFIPRTRSVPS